MSVARLRSRDRQISARTSTPTDQSEGEVPNWGWPIPRGGRLPGGLPAVLKACGVRSLIWSFLTDWTRPIRPASPRYCTRTYLRGLAVQWTGLMRSLDFFQCFTNTIFYVFLINYDIYHSSRHVRSSISFDDRHAVDLDSQMHEILLKMLLSVPLVQRFRPGAP